jgi:hypothetical protein
MKRRTLIVVVAGAALLGGALLGACSGDDADAPAADAPAADEPSPSAVLAEQVGCRSGSFTHAPDRGWQESDVHDCQEGVTARIYASLTGPERDAAVRLLSMEGSGQGDAPADSCNDFGPGDEPLYIIAGDTWVAVVSGRQEARDAASLLDGELQPGSLDVPSDSAVGAPCLPGS